MAPTDGVEEPVPPQNGHEEPSSPLELEPTGWKESIKRAVAEFKADRGSMTAASLAFYWFLAVFPGLIAAVGVLGLLNAGSEATTSIIKGIRTTLPGDAADVLVRAVRKAQDRSSGGSVISAVVGVALALWGASAGMVALQTGLNVAYDVPEDRKFVGKRLVALGLVVATGVFGTIATVFVVFGAPLGDTLRDNLPFGGTAFVIVWTIARWLLAVAALTVLFAVYYYLGPKRESPRWVWVSPGGVVAVVIWLIASLGFSLYVKELGGTSYGKTYGSLAGVVVLLFWLYLTGLAVVFGGELNAELERQAEHEKRGRARAPDRPAPGRPAATSAAAGDRSIQEWRERMRNLRGTGADGGDGSAVSSSRWDEARR